MYAFDYHRPKKVEDAARMLKGEAKLLAGGQTLLPTMKLRLASPSDLVDLGAISGLAGIKASSKEVTIGAMTTHATVAESKDVAKAIPALALLAGGIGDMHVRNVGTIGGSIANNDPAADYPAACLALNATIKTNKREIEAGKFFTGLFSTALKDDEVIVSVSFPVPQKAAYEKFRNPASRFALVGVFVAQFKDGARVAVTGAGQDGVFRVEEMEKALSSKFDAGALDGISVGAKDLNSDIHASAEYRAHLIGVMAKRAVAAAG